MSIDHPYSGASIAPEAVQEKNKGVIKSINDVFTYIARQREEVHPLIAEYFADPDLFNSLPQEIKNDVAKFASLVVNTSKFAEYASMVRNNRQSKNDLKLFVEEISIPETVHEDGRTRQAESGRKINLEALRAQGIDPAQVLFFRTTQPSSSPKPEFYWTSDYYETVKGLTREIDPEKRKSSVILAANLDVINMNGGLIQDVNDDNGVAVRQIGTENFDQQLALAKITLS
jgi:hypothetical protein